MEYGFERCERRVVSINDDIRSLKGTGSLQERLRTQIRHFKGTEGAHGFQQSLMGHSLLSWTDTYRRLAGPPIEDSVGMIMEN